VRRRRERAGLSIEELAGLTEVSVSTMSRIELGEQVISTDHLSRIATVLGTSPATLCRDVPAATAAAS
jgi:transcriptional regulator with XRE-family HTH domain